MVDDHVARKNWRCTLERAEKFISNQFFTDVNLYSRLYPKSKPVSSITHYAAPGRITYSKAVDGEYLPVKVGDSFGPTFILYIEMAANGLFGAGKDGLINVPDPSRRYSLSMAEIAVFDTDCYNLINDLTVIIDLAKNLPEGSQRSFDALYTANKIVNACFVDDKRTFVEAHQSIAKPSFGQRNGDSQHKVYAIGKAILMCQYYHHCHDHHHSANITTTIIIIITTITTTANIITTTTTTSQYYHHYHQHHHHSANITTTIIIIIITTITTTANMITVTTTSQYYHHCHDHHHSANITTTIIIIITTITTTANMITATTTSQYYHHCHDHHHSANITTTIIIIITTITTTANMITVTTTSQYYHHCHHHHHSANTTTTIIIIIITTITTTANMITTTTTSQ
ncbi:hypothetical protein QZH41_005689 [Actinostola sp. cb2023]|nr:hypothetical protein QZH41_005689 [Actinostola sp. cb2023]